MTKYIFGILFTLMLFTSSWAQSVDKSIVDAVEARRVAIESISIKMSGTDDKDLLMLRENLRTLRADATSAAKPLRDMRDQIQSDIDKLGPAPEVGQPASEAIDELRARLNKDFHLADEAIKQSEFNITRTDRLLENISDLRRTAFYNNIFRRGVSPYSKTTWKTSLESFKSGKTQFINHIKTASAERVKSGKTNGIGGLALGFFTLLICLWPLRRGLETYVVKRLQARPPSMSNRVLMSGLKSLAIVLSASLGGFVMYEVLRNLGFTKPPIGIIFKACIIGVISVISVDGILTSTLSPKNGAWRLVPLRSVSIRTIRYLALGYAVLITLDAASIVGANALEATTEITELQSIIIAILGGLFLLALTQKRLWALQEDQTYFSASSLRNWEYVRSVLKVLAIAAIIAAIFCYSALGRFIVTRIFFLGTAVAVIWFFRNCVQEIISYFRKKTVSANGSAKDKKREENLFFFG